MSHYNNNNSSSNNNSAANSWQSRPNNASTAASLFGQHDLGVNHFNVNNGNSSLANNPPPAYNPATANLLAQFAVNGVNFGNLAANLNPILGQNILGTTALAGATQGNKSKFLFLFNPEIGISRITISTIFIK